MSQLVEWLAVELERPRAISEQVIRHLTEAHGAGRDALGRFFTEDFPGLEDYEVDLALSPLFTPTLPEQAVFAARLGAQAIPRTQWPDLVTQLTGRPTRAHLLAPDGQGHSLPLRGVTIERFVYRLRLDGTIPDGVLRLLQEVGDATDGPLLQAVARRAIWETEGRRRILIQFLGAARSAKHLETGDAGQLLKVMETYEPENLPALLGLIPHWERVLQQELNGGAGGRPFFNERVEELHGGGRDQRRPDDLRLAAKRAEFEFLQRLRRALNPGVEDQGGT